MAAPRALPCLLAVAALTLTACTSNQSAGPPPGAATVAGTVGPGGPQAATPAPDPAPSTLTSDAYRAEIDGVRKPVRDALNKLADARRLSTLDGRVGDAEDALGEAADSLAALAAPPEVQAQHAAYVSALRGLAGELGDARGAVDSRSVCTASGLLARLGKSGELKALQEAGEALGDYPADVVSVKAPKQSSRRLPSGRYVRSERRNGRGSFKITNGGSRDAVVTLVRGKSKAISVYVRKKGKFTVPGVRDGKYRVYFTTGVDWDSKEKAFTRSCSFQRFEDSFRFKTTYTATQVRWQNWRITLHRIKGGNARTSDIDPGDFPS
ncbi:hypothetical protein [Streptosporangium sp. KLBMP 9127]|nr:hypothetical protein [Streptosporangium sp. KLBMP 9127]